MVYLRIVNAANPALYLRNGTSEWLHFRVVAAATPRVKTTHVLFRALPRYASLKYTHFLMREVGPFRISAHICDLLHSVSHCLYIAITAHCNQETLSKYICKSVHTYLPAGARERLVLRLLYVFRVCLFVCLCVRTYHVRNILRHTLLCNYSV